MSLEIALQENTNAIRELIAAIQAGAVPAAAAVEVTKPKTEKKATKTDEPAAEVKPSEPVAETEDETPSKLTEPATYEAVADAIKNVAKTKGRDVAVNLLKQFGVSKGPDLKVEQYAEVLAAAQTALAE